MGGYKEGEVKIFAFIITLNQPMLENLNSRQITQNSFVKNIAS